MESVLILMLIIMMGLCFYIYKQFSTIAYLKEEALKQKEIFRIAQEKSNKNAVNISRRVLKGKITEEICPLLPGFPYEAADMSFLGQPIDYICFNGYTDVRDANGEDVELIFLDIKTGRATLSRPQRAIKEAVIAKRISGATIRIGDAGEIKIEPWKTRGKQNDNNRPDERVTPESNGEGESYL
jgi:predicted Holliday junction resolvase-like endonuclease